MLLEKIQKELLQLVGLDKMSVQGKKDHEEYNYKGEVIWQQVE